MLIVRSPLRISLAGGGTDLPVYYSQFGGAVINLTIDRYFYVFLRTSSQKDIQITSADFQTYERMNGEIGDSSQNGLKLPRAILDHFGIAEGVNLFLASEAPPGSGLGSSSAVAVGLIKTLATACGIYMTKMELAELASYIEIEKLDSPIGKQDQYAAAFGGLNLITFEAHKASVSPLQLPDDKLLSLSRLLLLFYTGQNRNANRILAQQRQGVRNRTAPVLEALHRVKGMVPEVKIILERGDFAAFGAFLHKNWTEKKRFASGVSNPLIDSWYEQALELGAWGGKISGAGGGGFLLICCPEHRQGAVIRALEAQGLRQMPFSIDRSGARVLMNAGLRFTSRHSWFPPIELYKCV